MTDKQIIIDGVDVSECEYYGPIQNDCIVDNCLCSENPNCYYKQLKRKEQKLERIKQYAEDNEWCLLDDTYKELLQIIEGKENE